MIYWNEMDVGFESARSTVARWNGTMQGDYLWGRGYHMQSADCKGCYGVTAAYFLGEYCYQIGEYGSEQLSQHYQ